jgi:hypothetical protein
MGLDTTHDCWHGPYSQFMRWREELAVAAGLPPLMLMEGFFQRGEYNDPFRDLAQEWPDTAETYYRALPIRWESLRPSPLHILLSHSDCDGKIEANDCEYIANSLEALLPTMDAGSPHPGHERGIYDGMRAATERFIAGLRLAAAQGEDVEFH